MKARTQVAALALAGVLLSCGEPETPARLVREPAATGFVTAGDGQLFDGQGRHLILRGFNHIALRSDRNHPPYRQADGSITPDAELFELQDLDDEDFATIAGMGLNALRPVITWEFAQPDPPPAPYNEAYFQRIDDFIAAAKRHGLYVIFDFGQFGWGRAAGGNAGAPDWTISETCAQLPGPTGSAPPQASAGVGCNYYNFWQNTENHGQGLQDHYFDLWRFVAERYRDEPTVAMYDLYNEPFGGPIPPGLFELQFLFPFYQQLAAAIREIDPHHAIAFQPELYHSIGVPTPIAIPLGIDNAIYIPHEYTAAYFVQRLDPRYTPAQDPITRHYLETAELEAELFGTPWLIGETGWTRSTHADGVGGPIEQLDPEAPRQFARDFTDAADEHRLGWLWFAWSSIDEAYGVNYGGELDEELVRTLARPFPRATPLLAFFDFDPVERSYYQIGVAADPLFETEIALPMRWQYPDGACIRLDDEAAQSLPAEGGPLTSGLRFDPARQTLSYSGFAFELRIAPPPCS